MSELETVNETLKNLKSLKKSIDDNLKGVIRGLHIKQTELVRESDRIEPSQKPISKEEIGDITDELKVIVVYAKGYNYPLTCNHIYIEKTHLECHCRGGSIVEVPFDETTRIKKLTLDEWFEMEKKREELTNG